jgi:hypothetical protein
VKLSYPDRVLLLTLQPACRIAAERRGNGVGAAREGSMRFKPKNVAALQVALAGLPDRMKVEADPDVHVNAKTVGELRKVPSWPEGFVVATPPAGYPGSIVRLSRPSHATRMHPKP